jgi:dihydroorotate dehydrogenase electron transfer subunit
MRLIDAELIDSRRILPGQWMQWYHAPALAASVRAGQFVHVRTGDWSGLVLRRPFTVNTADPSTGVVSLHFREVGRGTAWLTHMRPGDRLDMLGPLGQGFVVDPRNRHLLLVAGGLGIADVRLLADEALRDGRQVVLLFGARDASEVYPSSLLPDELEYVVATEDGSVGHPGLVTDLVLAYEAWADQAFACGPLPMLRALAGVLAGRRKRLGVATLGRRRDAGRRPVLGTVTARRKAFLQVAMEQRMGCAVGACLGCVIWGVDGPQRVCREGPVFAADEIDWEATVPSATPVSGAPASAAGGGARGSGGARTSRGVGDAGRDPRGSRGDGGRR